MFGVGGAENESRAAVRVAGVDAVIEHSEVELGLHIGVVGGAHIAGGVGVLVGVGGVGINAKPQEYERADAGGAAGDFYLG